MGFTVSALELELPELELLVLEMVPPPEAPITLFTYCRTVLPPSEAFEFGLG